MIDEELLVQVVSFYNRHAAKDPSNAPTRREIGRQFGFSTSKAQLYLYVAEDRGLLCWPLAKKHDVRFLGGSA